MPSAVIKKGLRAAQEFVWQALIEVDADPEAERLVVLDRKSLTYFYNMKTELGIVKVIVPIAYATSNNLLIGILDDDGTYNAKFIDGVQASLINGLVTDIHA